MSKIPTIDAVSDPIRVAAVILAAGRSTRMGPENKLTAMYKGMPMVRHATLAAAASQVLSTFIVTGHESESIQAALRSIDVKFVHNTNYMDGLSTSVKLGIEAVAEEEIAGVLILLGDMPDVSTEVLDSLIETFVAADGNNIVQPVHNHRPGNPVLWPRRLFDEFDRLSGDIGARPLLARNRDDVLRVDVGTDAIHMDIDGPDDLSLNDALSSELNKKAQTEERTEYGNDG